MAILQECPRCKHRQTLKHRKCACGEDLTKAKKSQRVRYWIQFRLPNGRQRKEVVGTSLDDARDAEGKRRGQKHEGRIFDMLPENKISFKDLAGWYLKLEKVQQIKSYWRIELALKHFNRHLGDTITGDIRPIDLEEYQVKRQKEGAARGTVDKEMKAVKTMVKKAFFNDKIGGDVLKAFSRVKNLLKRNEDARTRILSLDEFNALMSKLPLHSRAIVATGFYTVMRKGEILGLTWDKVDMKNRIIRLYAEDTKDKEPRTIPICAELYVILESLPKAIRDNHVFLYQGEPFTDIRAALRKGCEDAGIPYGKGVKDGFIFHDLRHTFNTNMRKAGVPESVIMSITGHSTREMFDRYNTVDEEDSKEAINRLRLFLGKCYQNVTKDEKKESV